MPRRTEHGRVLTEGEGVLSTVCDGFSGWLACPFDRLVQARDRLRSTVCSVDAGYEPRPAKPTPLQHDAEQDRTTQVFHRETLSSFMKTSRGISSTPISVSPTHAPRPRGPPVEAVADQAPPETAAQPSPGWRAEDFGHGSGR